VQAHEWFRPLVAAGGAALSYLYGGWSASLGVLLFLAALDYASGFTAAAIEGHLSSQIGARGIAKKVFMFAIVAVGHLIDGALGEAHLIRDAAIYWYIANEVLSVVENMGRIGVPIPPVISRAVEVLRGKGEGANVR